MQNKNICPCCDSKNFTRAKRPVRIYSGWHIIFSIASAISLPIGILSMLRSETNWITFGMGIATLSLAIAFKPKRKYKMYSFNTCLECGETWRATQQQ